jgi:REP element-mobilizing transposase RayT
MGEMFRSLAKQKERQVLEGHLMPDHVHMPGEAEDPPAVQLFARELRARLGIDAHQD